MCCLCLLSIILCIQYLYVLHMHTFDFSAKHENKSGYNDVLSPVHKSMMLMACAAFVVLDLRPMFALGGDGLKQLLYVFAIICSTYVTHFDELNLLDYFLPSRGTVSAYLSQLAIDISVKLKSMLTPIFDGTGGAISLDIWADGYKRNSYICIVAHFIDEKFVLHNRVIANDLLDEDRKKTAEYVLEKIQKVLIKYGICNFDKIVFTTDRGSNIIAALKDKQHIACALHFINNCLQNVFKSGKPKIVMAVCKKIVRFIKKSGKNGKFSPALKSPSNVRWNFALTMFESLLAGDNWEILTEILNASPKRKLLERIEKQEILDLNNNKKHGNDS